MDRALVISKGTPTVARIDLTQACRTRNPAGLLTRIRGDVRGNTLAIVAAAMLPLTAMIGSGVDLARAYLVKTRMQQACDAGALAGRRSMSGTTLQQADKDEAVRFFRFNFPDGTMGTSAMSATDSAAANRVVVGLNSQNQIDMAATTVVPNLIMQMFGANQTRISVSCAGEEFYVNTDLMMVLDTTGSMNCAISDATTCGQATEKSNSKMLDLRNAVKTLYTNLRPAQDALEAKALRMRIGFVMYSSNVNVGKLVYAANSSYLNNPAVYKNATGTYGTNYNGPTQTSSWFTGSGGSNWNGCIVERQTDNGLSSSATSIPSTALDLDITTLPTSAASRWSPHVPSLYIKNNFSVANYADPTYDAAGYSTCPLPAKHMVAWPSTTAFNNYVDTIVTGKGGTYHDIGMIWGTRMIANTGIFAGLNPDTFNNVKVSRTIVLVTDGVMSPNADIYGAYGVERNEGRVYQQGSSSGSAGTEYTMRHEKRFNLMCDRAKTLGVDIWVVAILDAATPISTSLSTCATSGQAKKVSDAAQLAAAFKQIADKVGNLRIGK